MTRAHWIIYGDVQGVGYRYFALRAARDAGILAGSVRNRADGTVELEAEGEPAAMAALRTALARGPAHASVRAITDVPPGSGPLPRPFVITR